jgi:hypothetical protein
MKTLILVCLILIVQLAANGQTISGIITDENRKPLPYTNIGIVGLNRGTISSNNGIYKIDISGIETDKILRISSVGYESVDYKIGDLIAHQSTMLNVELKMKVFQLPEIVVNSKKVEPVFLGSKKKGKFEWQWSEAIQGAEIGTLLKTNYPVVLKRFNFFVKKNSCDSIYYRIRIYDGSNEFPTEFINSTDIRFMSRLKRGWESVDLTDFNIKVNGDFIITLETLDSWTKKTKRMTYLSVRKEYGPSYSRSSSMAAWTEFANQMSFRIEAKRYFSE